MDQFECTVTVFATRHDDHDYMYIAYSRFSVLMIRHFVVSAVV